MLLHPHHPAACVALVALRPLALGPAPDPYAALAQGLWALCPPRDPIQPPRTRPPLPRCM